MYEPIKKDPEVLSYSNIKKIVRWTDDVIKPYTLVGPPVWRPVQAPLAAYTLTTVCIYYLEGGQKRCLLNGGDHKKILLK